MTRSAKGLAVVRVAAIDDYQGVALQYADWRRLKSVEVVPFRDHVHDPGELVARLADYDAVLRVRERTEFPRSVLERLPKLKILLATGLRNARSIDLPAAKELGITVCCTDAFQRETIEITWWLILSLMRGVLREHLSVRSGAWQLGVGRGLTGKTLGVVGFGTMGIPVALVGRAFEMNVQAWSPNLTPQRTEGHGVRAVSKRELFESSDVISIHMPMSERSAGIIGADDIARMKRDAFLINTSRAPLVDEKALIEALHARRIGGYGVDVYDIEPLAADDPYRHLPNVIATPHVGYVTDENYRLFYGQSLENLEAWILGAPIRVLK